MKATDFVWREEVQNAIPDGWRIPEVINYGRSKDKDFYPVSKKGSEEHVNVMHAANVLYTLSLNASKSNIDKALKNRFLLRSIDGKYFLNELATLLKDPENFLPLIWDVGPPKRAVLEIRVSLDRPYVELVTINQQASLPNEALKELTPSEIIETLALVNTFSGGDYRPRQTEKFTILKSDFLREYSTVVNKTGVNDVPGKQLFEGHEVNRKVEEIKFKIHNFKKVEE